MHWLLRFLFTWTCAGCEQQQPRGSWGHEDANEGRTERYCCGCLNENG